MRTIPWLALILLFPVFASAQYTSKPPIIAYDNCEVDPVWEWDGDRTKKWSYWTGSGHVLPGLPTTSSMTRTSAFSRKGTYSYKARIVKDPTFNVLSGMQRSEMVFSTPSQPPIGWRWAAVSIYLPSDFCIDQAPMSIAFSTKANPDNYATPFRIDVRKGRYIAIRANVQTDGTVPGEIETDLGRVDPDKGVWVDWVYHRNFDMTSAGFLEVYKNGKLVYSYKGPNWVHGSGRTTEGYLPMGLYKWVWTDPEGMGWGPPSCNNPIEVYYDEYRFGAENATLQDFLIDQPAPPPPPKIAPTVAKPVADISVPYNTASHTVSLSGVFADDAGVANLQYSVSSNSNAALVKSAVITGTNLVLGITAAKAGTAVIKVKATDADGLSVEDQFNLTVEAAVTVAPTISSPIADQNLAFNTISKTISLSGVFADDAGVANLQYSVSSNSNAALVKSAVITGTNLVLGITAAKAGAAVIKVKATDADGLSVEDQFDITVEAAITIAPTISSPIADQSFAFNTGSKTISLSGVFADDQPVSSLIYAITGNTNTALITGAVVTGTTLNLTLAPGLSGIDTLTINATDSDGLSVSDQFIVTVLPKTPAVSLMINSGGAAVNFSGQAWAADKNFTGGKTYTTSAAINETTNDSIYQSERYGNMAYAVPVPAGIYTVRLHFAEIFYSDTNQRKFNVNVEGSQGLLTNYDIVAKAGAAFTPAIEEFKDISVVDGSLSIGFVSIVDNAKISAIEIIGETNEAPVVAAPIADQQSGVEIKTKAIALASVFSDDKAVSFLTYSVVGNTNKTMVNSAIISGANLSLGYSGTAIGKSQVIIRATDAEGLYAQDTFNITITNKIPVANAGADQTITLPVATVTLNGSGTDADGTIKAYTWSQTSGPAAVFSSK